MNQPKKIGIIIPTYNNMQYLEPCLKSLLNTNIASLFHIYVINNGHPNSCDFIDPEHKDITVINAEKNLGWEGGLKIGVEKSNEPFLLFLNDDTYFPQSSIWWAQQLLSDLDDPKVGAVGPSTNVVMGNQNIFIPMTTTVLEVNMLIGFCVLVKRKALMEAGGIDDTLPGGDDLDLSIRLRKAGYKLLVERRVFVYHHGFKTGERVKGTPDKNNGWNSYEMKESTDTAIIRKHGFREWFKVIHSPFRSYGKFVAEDVEGDIIKSYIDPKAKILELGVGGNKTVDSAIGIDLYGRGEKIPTMGDILSVADIVGDVQKDIPMPDETVDFIIGRHILEHMIDPIKALKLWTSKLKKGGKLIIAVPDHSRIESTLMNIEHVHAYTPESLGNLFGAVGLKIESCKDSGNGISFVIVGTKP